MAKSDFNVPVQCKCCEMLQRTGCNTFGESNLTGWFEQGNGTPHVSMNAAEFLRIMNFGSLELRKIVEAGAKTRVCLSNEHALKHLEEAIEQMTEKAPKDRSGKYGCQSLRKFGEDLHKKVSRDIDRINTSGYFHLQHSDIGLIKTLQEHFVFVPADKSPQTILVVCKHLYMNSVRKEVAKATPLQQEEVENRNTRVAEMTKNILEEGKINHNKPYPYTMPKAHKGFEAYRQVIGSSEEGNILTPISEVLSKVLRNVMFTLRDESHENLKKKGYKLFLVEDNLDEAARDFELFRKKPQKTNFRSTDFACMFPSATKEAVKTNSFEQVQNAFNHTAAIWKVDVNRLVMHYDKEDSKVTWRQRSGTGLDKLSFDLEKIWQLLNAVVDTAYFIHNGAAYDQNGLAIGGEASSELANLLLSNVERKHIIAIANRPGGLVQLCPHAAAWHLWKRYVDDMLTPSVISHLMPTKAQYAMEYSMAEEGSAVGWCGFRIREEKSATGTFTYQYEILDKQLVIPFKLSRYTHYKSMVPKHFFTGIIHAALYRVKNYISEPAVRKHHIDNLIKLWKERDYPERMIQDQMAKSMALLFNEKMDNSPLFNDPPQRHSDTTLANYQRNNPLENFCFINVILNLLRNIHEPAVAHQQTSLEQALHTAILHDTSEAKRELIKECGDIGTEGKIPPQDVCEVLVSLLEKLGRHNAYTQRISAPRRQLKVCKNCRHVSELTERENGYLSQEGNPFSYYSYVKSKKRGMERISPHDVEFYQYKSITPRRCANCMKDKAKHDLLGQIITWPSTLVIRTQIDINHKVSLHNMENYVLTGKIQFDKGHYKGLFKVGTKWIEANDLQVNETESPLNKILTPTTYALIYTRHAVSRERESIDVDDDEDNAGLNRSGAATPTPTNSNALSLVTVTPTHNHSSRQAGRRKGTPPPNTTIPPSSFPIMSASTSRAASTTQQSSQEETLTLSNTGLSSMTLRPSTRRPGSGDARRTKLLSLHPNTSIKDEQEEKVRRKYSEEYNRKTEQIMESILFMNKKHKTVRANDTLNFLDENEKCCEKNPCSPKIENKRKEMSHIVRENTAFRAVSRKGRLSDVAEGPSNTKNTKEIIAQLKKVENEVDEMLIAMQQCSSAKNDAQCKHGPLTSLSGLDDSLSQQKQRKTCKTMDMACATNLSPLRETNSKENPKKIL